MFQSVKDRDYFMAFNSTYQGKYADPGRGNVLKKYDGIVGDISYQWSGDAVVFIWKTDEVNPGSSMTAYVDF